jgi:hypothetical protein
MKKIGLLVVCVFFAMQIFAQGNYSASVIEKATKMTEQMKVKLNLNSSQVAQIQALNLEVVKNIDAASLKSNDKKLLESSVQNMNSYRDAQLRKVLTSTQYATLNANVNGRNCK